MANHSFRKQIEQNVFHLMQRLQQHSRANIPSMMAHRAMSSFSLQAEPAPAHATNYRAVMVYPQNPFISEPAIRRMHVDDLADGLRNSRLVIEDSRGFTAKPNADGNYLYPPGTPEFDQINAFYYTTLTLRMYERYAQREIPWAFPNPRLRIDPHVGRDANAFYSEVAHKLGFHTYVAASGVEASTAHSADIVSHEAAHAVLDGLRDLHNESFSLGPRAFHESFGDMTAVLVALHDDSLVRRLLNWTKGNLRTTNFVTEVAEHIISLLQADHQQHIREHTVYLRNAFNSLTYVPFDELPFKAAKPETELGKEEHNYSRLFTGAFYDILVGIYEHFRPGMMDQIALFHARDVTGRLLTTAVELGPIGEFDFRDMAQAFIHADQVLFDGKYTTILTQVFTERKLLSAEDIQAYQEQLVNLPDIQLPEILNTGMAASRFLEETVLPAIKLGHESDLIPNFAYRNARGQAFLGYFNWRNLKLEGEQYRQFSGAAIDAFGGLTLMFDEQNHLRSMIYRPVMDSDVHQIQVMVSDLIGQGTIVDNAAAAQKVEVPMGLAVSGDVDAPRKLVKYPVIIDSLPDNMQLFAEYLQQWQ